jgi:hypothetical protein
MTEAAMLRAISPVGGYAQGAYICTCLDCDRTFLGAKRASQCLPCAVIGLRAFRGPAVPAPVEAVKE